MSLNQDQAQEEPAQAPESLKNKIENLITELADRTDLKENPDDK